jgi:hypothetical protein
MVPKLQRRCRLTRGHSAWGWGYVLRTPLLMRPCTQQPLPRPCSPPAVGGIIGFALVYGGGGAVQWATPDPAAFPPVKGVVPIILSWFFSPILTGLASAITFYIVRTAVLRRANSYNLAYWVLPIAVIITTFINVFFVSCPGPFTLPSPPRR